MEELTPEQALQNLDNAVATIQANRQTHMLIQASVTTLNTALVDYRALQYEKERAKLALVPEPTE